MKFKNLTPLNSSSKLSLYIYSDIPKDEKNIGNYFMSWARGGYWNVYLLYTKYSINRVQIETIDD